MQEHGKVEDTSKRVEPTCVAVGTKYYKCTVEGCAFKYDTDDIDIVSTAHNMSDWTPVTQATCTQEGVQRQVCTNKDANGNSCTYYKTDLINKLQHVKSEKGVVTTPAKCGEKGEETFYCKTCDYVFETKDIDAVRCVLGRERGYMENPKKRCMVIISELIKQKYDKTVNLKKSIQQYFVLDEDSVFEEIAALVKKEEH